MSAVKMFQTFEGLQIHAEWLNSRLADCSIANDHLRKENDKLREVIDRYENKAFWLYNVDLSKYNKIVNENRKLKNSLQKVYYKYILPQLTKE